MELEIKTRLNLISPKTPPPPLSTSVSPLFLFSLGATAWEARPFRPPTPPPISFFSFFFSSSSSFFPFLSSFPFPSFFFFSLFFFFLPGGGGGGQGPLGPPGSAPAWHVILMSRIRGMVILIKQGEIVHFVVTKRRGSEDFVQRG